MKCIDCGKRKTVTGYPECWTYQKCGKCYHHGQKQYPVWKNTEDIRLYTRPTDMFLDKGMYRAIQEIEKL